MRNLDHTKIHRSKLNDPLLSQNYKTNLLQTMNTGDQITIQDRADSSLMKTQYKSILEHTFEVNKV
jgi:hypothetical protein